MKNELTESLEKYLLAVYEIVKDNKATRVRDVAAYLKIGGPSTSEAIKTLAQRKFINYVPYGVITITEKGLKRAEDKINRHKILSIFLKKVLLVEPSKVDECAKAIEYYIPDEVLRKIILFLKFLTTCTCKQSKWFVGFNHFIKTGDYQSKCKNCIAKKEGFDNSSCGSNCCK